MVRASMIGLLLAAVLSGCATKANPSTRRTEAVYQATANARLAEADAYFAVRHAVSQLNSSVYDRSSAAVRAGRSIHVPRLVGGVGPVEVGELGHRDAIIRLTIVLDKNGEVAELAPSPDEGSAGDPNIQSAVAEAVRLWRFTPLTVDDVPFACILTVAVKVAGGVARFEQSSTMLAVQL